MLRTGLLLLLALVSPVAVADSSRSVLLLQSFGRGFEPHETFSSALRAALAERPGPPLELHEISLETALFAGAEAESPFVDYLASFDDLRPLDLVIAVGGPATSFVQRNRGRLFTSTPLVIAGVDERHVAPDALTAIDAVVPIRIDLVRAIDGILEVRPETTTILVVLGRSPLERFWIERMRAELAPLAGRVRLEFLDGLSFDEILERAARPAAGEAIFFGMFAVDAQGTWFPGNHALVELRAASRVPIFGLYAHQVGAGIVGGTLLDLDAVARTTAGVALRVLGGEPPARFREAAIGPGVAAYDARELGRFGIDSARLPVDRTILFREPTFWAQYRWHVLGVATLCVAQAGLIGLLLAQRRRRQKAEDRLRASREQFALAVDGSTDGLWDWDVTTGEVFLSARGRAILGYDEREEVRDVASWDGRVREEDRERIARALSAHAEGGTPAYQVEYRVGIGSGGPRWVLARGKARRSGDGRAARIAGSLTDVTERRLAEHAVRDVSRRLIVVQEEERARLARELHDDMTQRLARLAIDAGRVERGRAGTPEGETMREVREGLARLSEDVHALSYRLHPSLLDDLGLADALQVECDRFSRQCSVPAELRLTDVPSDVPRDVSICLFRVAQEALRNIGRHARAHRVELRLHRLDSGLQLAVHDDGVGFDPAAARRRPSLGHASMRERVQLVDGEIDIDSAPGQGTTIVAWVPLDRDRP